MARPTPCGVDGWRSWVLRGGLPKYNSCEGAELVDGRGDCMRRQLGAVDLDADDRAVVCGLLVTGARIRIAPTVDARAPSTGEEDSLGVWSSPCPFCCGGRDPIEVCGCSV